MQGVQFRKEFWLPVLSEKPFNRGDVIYLDGGRGWHEVVARRPEAILVRKIPRWEVASMRVRNWPRRIRAWFAERAKLRKR